MSWRERLEAIEARLQTYPLWQRAVLYLLIALFVIYGGYELFLNDLFMERAYKMEQIAQLQSKIAKRSPKRYEARLKKLKKELAQLREELQRARAKEMELRSRLQKTETRFLDQKSLAKLLDDILVDSKQRGLALAKIDIQDTREPYIGKIEVTKRFEVSGQGRFLELVGFMRGIERHPMLLKIDDLHIETNGTIPQFRFFIKLYGVAR